MQKINMKIWAFVVFLLFFYVPCVHANTSLLVTNFEGFRKDDVDLQSYFKGLNGCAVILNPGKLQFAIYNRSLAEKRLSPFSTFKIVSGLLGLEYKVVKNAESTMYYNGSTYWLEAWNKNLTFKEAFQNSAVWYFRQIIDRIPRKTMQKSLKDLHYGNADVSAWQGNGSNAKAELNGFWLNSSLRISPIEQTIAMYNIFSMGSSFSPAHTELLADFMQVGYRGVYGKTGSDGKGQSWFVGFVKKGLYKDYFAFYVQDANDSAPHAKNIALEYFENE